MTPPVQIVVRGAREHNLKNVDVAFPRDRLVLFTGVSGSGKSSLAFDTIFAEGQRRYVESLSVYARQFLGQLAKPDVDAIEGLSPAIAIDQKSTTNNPRSTVGTVTEAYDYLRLLFARIGHPHCPQCRQPVVRSSVQEIVDTVLALPAGSRILVLGPLASDRVSDARTWLEDARKSGYVRARLDGEVRDLADDLPRRERPQRVEVVVDRLVVRPDDDRVEQRARVADSVEQALKLGNGTVLIALGGGDDLIFSERFACPRCGVTLPEIEPRTFSFNTPQGACPTCGGLGVRREFDDDLVVPRPAQTITAGAIAPWHYLGYRDSYFAALLASAAAHVGIDVDRPLADATADQLAWLLHGRDSERVRFHYRGRGGRAREFSVPWEGVFPMLQRLYLETPSEATRAGLEQYMTSLPCEACHGARLRPEALAVTIGARNIAELCALTPPNAMAFFRALGTDGSLSPRESMIAREVLREIVDRLHFLDAVGLSYLTLDRAAGTLSGGEAQRTRLATQIGSSLMGVLYILDEPSVGLHPSDTDRLLAILKQLRDIGNTVLVVEHDADTIRAADYVVDIGPGPGSSGGRVVIAGTVADIEACPESITGQFLSGRRSIPVPSSRRSGSGDQLRIVGAREHNLRNLHAVVPLGCLVAVSGVSGSGKSTLVDDILLRAVAQQLHHARARPGAHDSVEGIDQIDKVVAVDQSPIGRTPRSNPATYSGAFGPIRELFASVPEARVRGYRAGRFSFNVKGGRCEACRGEGMVVIEMQFLPDVYVPCNVCHGKRYNREALEIRLKGQTIADVLDLTVDDAVTFFRNMPPVEHRLAPLATIGLGYIRLGQSATTLSGGEAQRMKLAAELARRATGRTLYVLDEPTTGLHVADVAPLLVVLHRLVDAGNTVVVVEHHLDVLKSADWVIDLGPGAGRDGGSLVVAGTPEQVAACSASVTGRYLHTVLPPTGRGAAEQVGSTA